MSKQRIQLSDHFTYSRLLRFVLPCIGTMLFTSIYGIVDGLCVSNFVGKTAFAAVNCGSIHFYWNGLFHLFAEYVTGNIALSS